MKPTTTSGVSTPPALKKLLGYLDHLGHEADLKTLSRLLGELEITRDGLGPACKFKPERYQRNPIRQTDWYELLCLCWQSGQRTPIHDHAGSACAFLVVEGVASESRFERTDSGLICPVWTKHHEAGYICASAEADIHQVSNAQPAGEDLITLHIYSPRLANHNVYTLDTLSAADPASITKPKHLC